MRITELGDVPSKNLSSPRFHRHFWSASAGCLGAVEASWVAHRAETEGGKKDTFGWARRLQRRIGDRGRYEERGEGRRALGREKDGCLLLFRCFLNSTLLGLRTYTVRVKPWGERGKLHTHFPSFSSNRQFDTRASFSRSISFHSQASAAARALLYLLHPSFFYLNNLSLQ